MKRRTAILLAILEAAFVLTAVYFEPTCCVRGHLRGEAFYNGKSTSWWRHELEQWDVDSIWLDLGFDRSATLWSFQRNRESTWLDRLKAGRWQFWKAEPQALWWWMNDTVGPALTRGQPEAEPVLRELLDDPSPKIRRFARIGLKMEPETPREE